MRYLEGEKKMERKRDGKKIDEKGERAVVEGRRR